MSNITEMADEAVCAASRRRPTVAMEATHAPIRPPPSASIGLVPWVAAWELTLCGSGHMLITGFSRRKYLEE